MKLFRGFADNESFFFRLSDDGTAEKAILDPEYPGYLNVSHFEDLASAPKLLPCVEPSKIVCVGRNYAAHAEELGNELPSKPLLFLKAPSSVISNGDSISLPRQSELVEHEGELGIVIGRKASKLADDVSPDDYIFGYTCLNDVTARDLQRADIQFTRSKSFDTFCPVGPYIETELDTKDVTVEVFVNGQKKQSGRTSQMVFDIPYLLRYISNQMTLLPGDLIATGTPSGVSKLNPGDICEVTIEGIGTLKNPVEQTVSKRRI
ncbi:MAG: fumarylacetoacetate hydrolase family protein [Pyrinomonadaceae bacterium]|nr:fumarylacetoacetate hydrolase family protein [Pyrinomonadaceae bacterium]